MFVACLLICFACRLLFPGCCFLRGVSCLASLSFFLFFLILPLLFFCSFFFVFFVSLMFSPFVLFVLSWFALLVVVGGLLAVVWYVLFGVCCLLFMVWRFVLAVDC